MKDRVAQNVGGHSLVFNLLFVVVNLAGVTFITLGFHEEMNYNWWYIGIGSVLLLVSVGMLIMLKGSLLMAYVSRLLVGSLFIVSGLIKANDPIGFSYKLEEYFEDGALAFRIKEWFSMPEFSLEFFIPYALTLSVVICVIEILLGVLVLIGGKIKLTAWSLLLMIGFFLFLTWHTASCNPDDRFVDRDVYAMNSELAQTKVDEAKTNKDVRIISKKNGKVVVDEVKGTQCVLDCGCFGDAMKGSVGRSLTPKESMWKDIVLLYFVIWIFITQRRITPNTSKENVNMISISLVLVLLLSYVFGWYFPLTFATIALLGALWIKRVGGVLLGNFFGASLWVVVLCGLMTTYVLMYEPMKDYRPYAVGSNLIEKMHDGIPGVFQSVFKMKDLKTNQVITLSEAEYMDPKKKLWEDSTLKFISMESLEVKKGKLPSIDSAQFNPTLPVSMLTKAEKRMPYVDSILSENLIDGVLLRDKKYHTELEVALSEYDTTVYDTTNYQLIRKIGVVNPELADISVRDMITHSPKVLVIFSRNVKEADWKYVYKLKEIFRNAQKDSIPMVLVTSSLQQDIDKFRKKYDFNIPTFVMDFIEIKVVTRSNPSLMVVMNGVVSGKYPFRSTPTYDWIRKHIFFKNIK